MKYLAAILASSATCGLLVFLLFGMLDAFQWIGTRVTVDVTVLVLLIAALTTGTGAISTLFVRRFDRGETLRFDSLEQRVSELERTVAQAPKPPAAIS